MSPDRDGRIELSPDLGEYRAHLRSRLPVVALVVVLLGVRAFQGSLGAAIVVVSMLVFVAVGAVHIRTSRVVLSPTTVEHHGLVVRDRVIARDDAHGVLGVMTQTLGADTTTLVVQSRSTGASLRVFGGLWSGAQLATILDHVGGRRLDQPVDARTWETHVPGAIPLRYRRPFLFALGVGAPLFAGVLGLALVTT